MKNLIFILCVVFTLPLFAKTLQGRGPNGSANYENFILSGNAELEYKGVRNYRDGTSAVPTTCAGTDPDGITIDRVKSQAMSDDFHWMVFKSPVNSIGSGIAVDFEISRSAVIPGNQIEIGGIIKDFVSGALGDGSPFKVFIYDRGKSQLLNSFDGSTVFKQGGAWARWFTPSDSRQYTLCFHVTSNIADPAMFGLDDMYAKIKGPDVILYQEENTFSAFVDASGATPILNVISGSEYWVGAATLSDTSLFSIPLKGLNNVPKCHTQVTTGPSTTTRMADPLLTSTSTNLLVRTTQNGAASKHSFTVTCILVDSDRKSPNVVTPADTFSTNTANLTYASSAQYTLATLANAPVGTFITFTYAANTDTRVQTTTAPTQTTADMRLNGIRLYTRSYTQASTAQNPSSISIQIGKGLKGVSLNVFKSSGKNIVGSLDYGYVANTTYGTQNKDYNETTGVLNIDLAYASTGSNTGRFIIFSDLSAENNGYLVINASKSPVVVTGMLRTIYARVHGTGANQSCNNATACLTTNQSDEGLMKSRRSSRGAYVVDWPTNVFKRLDGCHVSSDFSSELGNSQLINTTPNRTTNSSAVVSFYTPYGGNNINQDQSFFISCYGIAN